MTSRPTGLAPARPTNAGGPDPAASGQDAGGGPSGGGFSGSAGGGGMMPGPLGPARAGGLPRGEAPARAGASLSGPEAVAPPPSPAIAQSQAAARSENAAKTAAGFEEEDRTPGRPSLKYSQQDQAQSRPLNAPPAEAPPRFGFVLRIIALAAGIFLLLHPAVRRLFGFGAKPPFWENKK